MPVVRNYSIREPLSQIAGPTSRHRCGEPYVVRVDPILGGLYHEYTLAAA
jgi:hypothetical protein